MRNKLAALLLSVGLLGLTACSASTESTEIGVRVVKATVIGSKGVQDDIYPQGGTYFFFRPLSDWYIYDVGLQNLQMTREHGEGSRVGDDSLRFKTIDGNDISVNVTIAWNIDPTMAPYIARFVGTSTDEVQEKLVRPVSRTVVRDVLNQLTSEEYYAAERRFAMGEQARERLSLILNQEGIIVEQVLLGEHKFNPEYEQTIKDKKVAEQEASRLVAETEAAGAEMERDLEKAKGRVSQAVEDAKGVAGRKRLEADAIFFEREKQAEAILAEKRASAEGLTAKAKAMAGSGGRSMVKLKVAESLKGKEIVFVPAGTGVDLRSTDMNALLQTYGATTLK